MFLNDFIAVNILMKLLIPKFVGGFKDNNWRVSKKRGNFL